ncbi:MAG TPA: hypothetical protein VH092_33965 [Urbifossiella sp.]|jgi:hypothetical protein|nr:hypothetical protein [Urbifossiella sp.]
MSKWAVLVVHGVGDTGPGITVDNFLWSLVEYGAALRPDGARRVLWYPDRPPGNAPAGEPPELFPVHVRRAAIPGAAAPAPTEAVLAEVYWADLSRIRDGTLHLLLGLVSMIFLLRFIPDWAAYLDGRLARLVRLLLHVASWWLCGPVAAVNALLAVLAGGYFWVVLPLTPQITAGLRAAGWEADPQAAGRAGLLALSGLVAAGSAGVTAWCRLRRAGSTWARFWFAAAVAAAVTTTAIGLVPTQQWFVFLPRGVQAGHLPAAAEYPVAVLLGLLEAVRIGFFTLNAYLFAVVIPVWAAALVLGSGGRRPGRPWPPPWRRPSPRWPCGCS